MRRVVELAANFHWIVPGEAARAGQVPPLLLHPLLEGHGIKSLINLRGQHPEFGWWRREEQVCLRAGVRHLNAMLDSRRLPTRTMLNGLWDCFARAKPHGLVLIKCASGRDRTSLAAALYLLETQGWGAMSDALAQFARRPYRHAPAKQQRWLKAFPEFAREEAGGRPIREWMARDYDPVRLAAWLVRRLGPESCAGIYKG